MQKSVKVGLWGVGLNTYWGQFEELPPPIAGLSGKNKALALRKWMLKWSM